MEVVKEGMVADRDSKVNSCRIAAVIDRLAAQFSTVAKIDSFEFFNLCLSLARGIDYAVANQEIPTRAPELPLLLKQILEATGSGEFHCCLLLKNTTVWPSIILVLAYINLTRHLSEQLVEDNSLSFNSWVRPRQFAQVCRSRNDTLLLTAIMVLMISVKNACQSKWFSDRDSEELCGLANQIGRCFCSPMDFGTEPSSSQTTISTIMTRFYPRLKMGEILLYLEVKPGFGAYVKDIQISKRISRYEKIKLLVAQTDNTVTSLCLISPQDANFLLNGKGVDRRTNVFMDTGPQMPTNVNHFLKYGTNLLQAVGQFNGNYVIVIALMSELPTMDNPVLQDYVQPASSVVDSDSEIIEGPSRISLNCPISFKRIKTPVKGHSCKHLQCFDFDNYMDINSKRPSWRCPHCNHHVCFTDIRIDQNMVLKDVGKNVNDVIISADGSWKSIMESDDHTEKEQDKYSLMEDNGSEETGSAISNTSPVFLDLTGADDVLMVDAEDRKVFPNNSEAQGISENVTSSLLRTRSEVNQNISLQTEDNFWTGIYLSTFGSTGPMSDQLNSGIPETSSTNALLSPVLADASSPTPDCEAGVSHGNALVSLSGPQSEISSQSALVLQPLQLENSSNSSEYGRSLSTARYMSRTPVAVQALPAQAPTTVPKRSRLSPSDLIQSIPLAAAQTSAASFSRNNERQQQFARSHDSFQASNMASPSLPQTLYPQQQDRQFSSAMPQQIPGWQASNHVHVSYPSQPRLNTRLPITMNPSPGISSPQTLNLRIPQTVNQSTGVFRPSVQSLNSHVQLGGSQGLPGIAIGGMNGQQARTIAAQRPSQVTRAPRIQSFPGNGEGNRMGDQGGITGSVTHSATRLDASGTAPADPDWRPPGRMRGSLSGLAYDALSQHIIQPTQQTQTTRAPSAPIPPNASTQLQILLANRAAIQAAGNPTSLSSMSGGSGALPPGPSEMN